MDIFTQFSPIVVGIIILLPFLGAVIMWFAFLNLIIALIRWLNRH